MKVFEGYHSTPVQLQETSGDFTISTSGSSEQKKKILVLVDTSEQEVTLEIPSVSSYSNNYIYIKDVSGNAGTNNIILTSSVGDFFGINNTSSVINTNYGTMVLFPNNTTWQTASVPAASQATTYSDYETMSASILANTSSVGALYNKNDSTALIGYWYYDTDVEGVCPLGKINLQNVSDSQYAWQSGSSPTTGLTRIIEALYSPGGFPASGTCTIWDKSAGAPIASGVSFTYNSGDGTITFESDPGSSDTDDLYYVEGVCEFGEIKTRASGGVWVPYANTRAYWDSGLQAAWGTTYHHVRLYVSGFPNDDMPQISVFGEVFINRGFDTNSYYTCLGFACEDAPGQTVSGARNSFGTFYRVSGEQLNLTGIPAFQQNDQLGTAQITDETAFFGVTSVRSTSPGSTQKTYIADAPTWTDGNNRTVAADVVSPGEQAAPVTDVIFGGYGWRTTLRNLQIFSYKVG